MGKHDTFNASATATWIECSYSALNKVPQPPKKESTVAAAEAGTLQHEDMEAGDIAEVEHFISQLEPGEQSRELRVKLTDDCGGTLDFLNLHPYVTTILDGKFGKWDVPAFHNMQLFTYAACVLKLTQERGEQSPEWWRFVIYQPNGLDEEPWKQWITHRTQVEAHRDRVLRALADRSAPKPGPHCRWCDAFQQCPTMLTDAGFMMGALSRRVEDLTTEELARMLRIIRSIGDMKEVYEDALTTHLKMGRTAEGVSLKPGRAFRSWNDPVQAAAILHQHYGPKGVKPLSPAQAEKLGLAGKQYAAVGAHKPEAPLKVSY